MRHAEVSLFAQVREPVDHHRLDLHIVVHARDSVHANRAIIVFVVSGGVHQIVRHLQSGKRVEHIAHKFGHDDHVVVISS